MGYESRFYIVEKSENCFTNEKGFVWGDVVAMFDLCKAYQVFEKIKKYPNTNCYIYIGDNKITEDCYGDTLKEIPISDMIKILEKVIKNSDYEYRRYKPFLKLLKGFDSEQWNDNLVVLHYGH